MSIFYGGVAHAQSTTTSYTLLAPLPKLNGQCPSNSTCNDASSTVTQIDVNSYISYAYKLALALAVVLAVFMITVGGFEYMLSSSITDKKNAQEKIWNAVLGLLLALCSYLLLYTIDPNLILSNLNSFSNLSSQEKNLSGSTANQLLQGSTASNGTTGNGSFVGGGGTAGGAGAGGNW